MCRDVIKGTSFYKINEKYGKKKMSLMTDKVEQKLRKAAM